MVAWEYARSTLSLVRSRVLRERHDTVVIGVARPGWS